MWNNHPENQSGSGEAGSEWKRGEKRSMGKCIYILIPWVLGFGTYVIKKKPDKNWDETAEDLLLLIFIEGVASFFVAVAVAIVSSV